MADQFRVGVDIGGTFTDLVMINSTTGRLFNEKVLTTPDDPSQCVLQGVGKILESNGVSASNVQQIIHGTTLVANAIIERRGAAVALITTKGFGDIQEIGTELRYDTYDLFMETPVPLVPRPVYHQKRSSTMSATRTRSRSNWLASYGDQFPKV